MIHCTAKSYGTFCILENVIEFLEKCFETLGMQRIFLNSQFSLKFQGLAHLRDLNKLKKKIGICDLVLLKTDL